MAQTRSWSVAAAALAAFVLSACGGGAELGGTTGGTLGGTTGGTTGGGTGDGEFRVGILGDGEFTEGAIAISQTPLESGGSSGLRVDIVEPDSTRLITETATVTFSSACQAQDQSRIDSPVITSTGSASSTYRAQGCSGTDVITATVDIGGETRTATAAIDVLPSPASAISFVSAAPSVIALRGSGRPDTSIVVFRVTNAAGGPVPDQPVVFSLDTTVGGITLNPVEGVTDSTGQVQTTVNAGTVHTSVRITARLLDNTGTADLDESTIPPAQSDSLVISTGLSDQDSFSLSVGCFNIEGDTIDGTTTNVNIRAADRFNNPVPDGTAVAFTAEGGSIQPQCLTVDGGCSVTFTSQNPRRSDHRVTLLASAIGEESFSDINGDGRFDAGEPFLDLGEAFRDDNENGIRESAEPFLDFDDDEAFAGPGGNFTGVLCDSGCDASSSLHVREQAIIIMSGSTALFDFTPNEIDLSDGPVAVRVDIGDDVGQPMPGGSTIEASTTLGSIVGDASFEQACTTLNGPFPYTFVIEPPQSDEADSGVFTVKVTSPSGIVSSAAIGVLFSPTASEPPPPVQGELGSIKFISADPTTIAIRGAGLDETADVLFQVFSDTGAPIANQPVTFTLSTTVGGIELNPTSAVSDENGFVRTIVRAGTVHTSVRVRATATSGSLTVTSQSGELAVTTGLPDQDSFSLSAECFNVEALGVDGVEVPLTIRAADRFNNPAPDGTPVVFTTEGGAVVGNCSTIGGACTVNWISQNPRPLTFCDADPAADTAIDCEDDDESSRDSPNGALRGGRATILATTIGEESFVDADGDGRYDFPQTVAGRESFGDLAEAFRDDDEDGLRDTGLDPSGLIDEFLDFDRDGAYDAADGRFNGVLCDPDNDAAANNCTPSSLHVREGLTIIMSASGPSLRAAIDPTFNNGDITIGGAVQFDGSGFTIPAKKSGTIGFVIRDANFQPLPAGTTVALSVADAGTVSGTSSFTVPCTTNDTAEGNLYTFGVKANDPPDPPEDQSGLIELKVTSPRGVASTYVFGLTSDVP